MTIQDRTADFFDFGGVSYLNCAFHGALPRVAVAAAEEALELKKTPHLIRDEHHFTYPDGYRAAVGELIGAPPLQIAVTDSTTHGIMLLVNGLRWRSGDEVILPKAEFPANLFPWRSLEEKGVVVRQVEISTAEEAPKRIEEAICERTRVVSVSWVNYSNGARLDLGALSQLCRSHGVLFAVDGSQGIGGLAFDLADTPCDLLACSGYKWLLGPYGLGFAYVAPELGDRLSLGNVNWFSIVGARDFNRLSRCDLRFEPGARRFDVNEAANFTNVAAGTASLRYLGRLTPEAVEAHNRSVLERLVEGLPAGFRAVSQLEPAHRSNIVCIAAATEEETERAHAALVEHRIVVSRREGSLRVSPHVFNNERDIDRLLEVLAASSGRGAVSFPGREPAPPTVGEPVRKRGPVDAPARVVHAGRTIFLRPLDPEVDVEDLYPPSHGEPERERIWTYLPYGPFADRPAMRRWLAECAASADPLFFAVSDNASSRRIGMVSFLRIDSRMRSLELGHIWYVPEAQRTQTNTESIYLMLCEAFDRLGCRRVEWKCDSLNERSRRAALRLGFRFEGVFRQHMIVKDRNRDTAWYAMLDRDWPTVRANMERWLDSPAEERSSLAELNVAQRRAN